MCIEWAADHFGLGLT